MKKVEPVAVAAILLAASAILLSLWAACLAIYEAGWYTAQGYDHRFPATELLIGGVAISAALFMLRRDAGWALTLAILSLLYAAILVMGSLFRV